MSAKLALPNLPLYLYRYRSVIPRADDHGRIRPTIDREIASLTEPYVYCAPFDSLNDPMEGFYRPSRMLASTSEYDKIVREIYSRKIHVGMASFSDTKENELMWTHYAGNYSGICIEYYAGRLLRSLPDGVEMVRLGYDDQPPRVSAKDWREKEAAARKIFSQKKFNWGYEREWRILGGIGKLRIDPAGDVLRRVYLGSRIGNDHKQAILDALKKSRVGIYLMEVDGYSHRWVPIHGRRFGKRKVRKKKRA